MENLPLPPSEPVSEFQPLREAVEFIGYWIGVTDPSALSIAQGIVLGGIVLFALNLIASLVIGAIIGAFD